MNFMGRPRPYIHGGAPQNPNFWNIVLPVKNRWMQNHKIWHNDLWRGRAEVSTCVLSILQLYGKVLQYLSGWLTTTRRHHHPCLSGMVLGGHCRDMLSIWGLFISTFQGCEPTNHCGLWCMASDKPLVAFISAVWQVILLSDSGSSYNDEVARNESATWGYTLHIRPPLWQATWG